MSVRRQFFCDYCNLDQEERDPDGDGTPDGLEPGQGYWESEEGVESPFGWWKVPGLGPRGDEGDACPHCTTGEHAQDVVRRRAAETRRLLGEPTAPRPLAPPEPVGQPPWPAHTSPFAGVDLASPRPRRTVMSPITGSQGPDPSQPGGPAPRDPSTPHATSAPPAADLPGYVDPSQEQAAADDAVPSESGEAQPDGEGESQGEAAEGTNGEPGLG